MFKTSKGIPIIAGEENGLQPTENLVEMLEFAIYASRKTRGFRENSILDNADHIKLEAHGNNNEYKVAWIYDKTGEGFQMIINFVKENGVTKHRPGDITG